MSEKKKFKSRLGFPITQEQAKKNVLRKIKRKAKELKDKPHTDFVANPEELKQKDYSRRYTGATGKEYAPTFPEFDVGSPRIKGLSTKNKKPTTFSGKVYHPAGGTRKAEKIGI